MRRHAKASRGAFIAILATLGVVILGLVGAGSAAAVSPQVKIGTPQNPTFTTVEVSAEVNPEGESVQWILEVSKDGGANWEIPGEFEFETNFGEVSGTGFQSIGPKTLKGLKPGTAYMVRLRASNFVDPEVLTPEPNPSFTTEAVPAPALTIDPVATFTATTAHFTGKVKPNAPAGDPAVSDVHWHFQCSPTCPGIETDTEAHVIAAAESEGEVEVDATGLEPNTTYEVKLVGTNAGGTFESAPQSFKTPAVAPSATTTPPLLLGGKVQLGGRVNAHNTATKYWVEYGTTTAYGTTIPATEDGDAGSDGAFHTVTETVADFQPGATYHVRVVAESAVDRTDGQDIEFTIPVPPDPDAACPNAAIRAEQQVNLPDCRAYELVSRGNGNFGNVYRVTGASDAGDRVAYISTAADNSATSSFEVSGYVGSRAPTGWSQLNASPVSPQVSGAQQRIGQQLAVSDDFSKVLIETTAGLDPRDKNEGQDLYLVDVPSGQFTMVSASTVGGIQLGTVPDFWGASPDLSHIYFSFSPELIPGAGVGHGYEWNEGELSLLPDGARRAASGAGLSARPAHNGRHAVSDDGSVFFWGGLYDDGTSTAIAPNATFIGASHDGDTVYFASLSELGENATPGGGIYRYVHSSDQLDLLTPAAGPGGLGVTEAVMSDDASHIYFIARAAVAPGAEPGVPNLYVQEGEQTRFIATVPDGAARIARTSRDGRYAILGTTAPLAGAQTNGHLTFYEFDDQANVLACVSCPADGTPSQGNASLDDTREGAGVGNFAALSASRNISDDGRVFFATTDSLVSADTDTASDVYEYFRGSVSLLSTSQGRLGAVVADNGDDGRDIFIVTAAALVPEDDDGGLVDIYDVRSGGGYPALPPSQQPSCEGNCQARSGAPPASAVGSETVAGDSGSNRSKARISVARSAAALVASVALKVTVSSAGDISLSGGHVKQRHLAVSKAGTYPVKAILNGAGRSLLEEQGTVRVPVTVSFAANDGSIAKKNLTLAFRSIGSRSKGAHR